jgi:hypothetical protein
VSDAGKQKPVIIIEPENSGDTTNDALKKDLIELGNKYDRTRQIKNILIHPEFPVDIRHNAKIFREKLAQWAADQISRKVR